MRNYANIAYYTWKTGLPDQSQTQKAEHSTSNSELSNPKTNQSLYTINNKSVGFFQGASFL